MKAAICMIACSLCACLVASVVRADKGPDELAVAAKAPAAPPALALQRVSRLLGRDVVNAQGEDLGEISDVVIDPESGHVAYMVLSSGGFMGVGEKLFAIPARVIHPQPGGDKLVLDIDKERLRHAPGFDQEHWPDMADQHWGSQVYQYYGVKPYWEESRSESDHAPVSKP